MTPENCCFVLNFEKSAQPRNSKDASNNPSWENTMNLEMEALLRKNTWIVP